MNIIHDISKSRITAEKFVAVTEISKGSNLKYEIDKETGLLALDRILKTSMVYPCNYGFIPRTLSEDGDPLDVMIIMDETIPPMTLIECRPVGVIYMEDCGERDEKILAVPTFSKLKESSNEMSEFIAHFFATYKALEKGKIVKITGGGGVVEAGKIIEEAINLYEKKGAKKK